MKCESGNFRLHTPKRHGSDILFVGTEYISLTQPDMDYGASVTSYSKNCAITLSLCRACCVT